MNKFYQDLQRRNVPKAAISYVAISWAIIQVAAIMFPTFDMSERAMRSLMIFLTIGFPLWVIFAYYFEWTPSGFKKTDEVAPESSIHKDTGKRLNKIIIGGLMIAVMLLLIDRFFNVTGKFDHPIKDKSIAVMPFNNMGGEADAYFAKGVAEDIRTHLSKIGDLRILSNLTLRDYDSRGKTVKEIGDDLGVNYLLTGNIQRGGEQLRITCQLVQVNNEEQTWAEHFDKRIDDIFAIQTQVATEVAQGLEVELTVQETDLLNTRPTENLEAYNLYLQGNSYYNTENEENIQKAIVLYKQAIALDKHFIEPFIGLISAYSKEIYGYGTKPLSFLDSLYNMSKLATEIAPKNAAAWENLAYISGAKGDLEKGIVLSRKALSLNPNSARSTNVLGLFLRDNGLLDQAIPLFEKAKSLEPVRSMVYNYNLSMSYQYLEMFEESEQYIKSSLNSLAAQEINYMLLGDLYVKMGDKDKILDCINDLLNISQSTFIHNAIVKLAFYGELDDAIIKEYVDKVVSSDDYASIHHVETTIALCYLLKKENQIDSLNIVLDNFETRFKSFYRNDTGGEIPRVMAEVELLRGNNEKALLYIEEMINLGNIGGYVFIKHNRLAQHLLDDTKYLILANKMEQEMRRQRMNLSARQNQSVVSIE